MDVPRSQYNIKQCHLCFKRHVWAAVFSISGFHALSLNWLSQTLNAVCFHILRMRKRLPAKHKLPPQHTHQLSKAFRVEKQEFDSFSQICGEGDCSLHNVSRWRTDTAYLTGTLFILASNTMTRAWKQGSVTHNVSPTQMKTIICERTSAAPPPRQRYLKLWIHATGVFT